MKILISGAAKGIGLAVAKRFLSCDNEVIGLDIVDSPIVDKRYTHYICDVKKPDFLPDIKGVEILFLNAGRQNGEDDIADNLYGCISVTEKYAFQSEIKSVLFNASASASSGFEFPYYVASKAGVVGYMKNVAVRLAEFKATANSISLGGVLTESNLPVISDNKLWKKIMDSTPLKKWMTEDEVCDWVVFLTTVNRSMTGEDVFIDNGEYKLNSTFVWPNSADNNK